MQIIHGKNAGQNNPSKRTLSKTDFSFRKERAVLFLFLFRRFRKKHSPFEAMKKAQKYTPQIIRLVPPDFSVVYTNSRYKQGEI